MADAKGVATVVQSVLQEIGVAGTPKVSKDGKSVTAPPDDPQGKPVHVLVEVEDLP
ncbi:hypothetical protein [Sphingomonas sp.]|uniref:hypothetical protein n=1 Tax=Sphingomonas sp. TaxID=28214 RepID=UPI003B00B5D9